MPTLPHDVTDLYLAPIVLALDERLEELGALTDDQLRRRIAVDADESDWVDAPTAEQVLRTIAFVLDLRGWELAWHARGIALSHGRYHIVLGAPANLTRYAASGASA